MGSGWCQDSASFPPRRLLVGDSNRFRPDDFFLFVFYQLHAPISQDRTYMTIETSWPVAISETVVHDRQQRVTSAIPTL
jgi:hypothetical protein